jgi:hypothetical protein
MDNPSQQLLHLSANQHIKRADCEDWLSAFTSCSGSSKQSFPEPVCMPRIKRADYPGGQSARLNAIRSQAPHGWSLAYRLRSV